MSSVGTECFNNLIRLGIKLAELGKCDEEDRDGLLGTMDASGTGNAVLTTTPRTISARDD